jgi:ATP-dependent Clp protease protease subunit
MNLDPGAEEPHVSTSHRRLAESRYVLPSFVERTSYGIKEMNPYNKLFEERIIFLGVQIDDASANDVMAQLITLESIDPEVQTICIGQAASAAAVLLAAGTPGKRLTLPNARILLHQPATEGGYGQSSDLEIQAREILRMRGAMEKIVARHTGRSEEQVRLDIERDKFFTAEEAKEYGLVDEVLTSLKRKAEVGSS